MTLAFDPARITAVVNTGDDTELHGLHISPDIDTVIYTLAGAVNQETGWGLAGETWTTMERLESIGGEAWFKLGDCDLATHLHRTHLLRQGVSLTEVTAALATSWGLSTKVLPMTNGRVRTMVRVTQSALPGSLNPAYKRHVIAGEEISFQEYFVGLFHSVGVSMVEYSGATTAALTDEAIRAIKEADTLVICPSNPVLSIGPLLALSGARDLLEGRRDSTVAISPIVGGQAIKGPAVEVMHSTGLEPTAYGVAKAYRSIASNLVIDEADAGLAGKIEDLGISVKVTDTIMSSRESAARLASEAIAMVCGP